jgi:hypothetical protein
LAYGHGIEQQLRAAHLTHAGCIVSAMEDYQKRLSIHEESSIIMKDVM